MDTPKDEGWEMLVLEGVAHPVARHNCTHNRLYFHNAVASFCVEKHQPAYWECEACGARLPYAAVSSLALAMQG